MADLLNRGADPNAPDPMANFNMLITTTSSIALVKLMINSGLRLNDTCETSRKLGHHTDGTITLLDQAYAIAAYLDPLNKLRDDLAKMTAGGLSGRRRFIYETIKLLEASGAKRFAEIG